MMISSGEEAREPGGEEEGCKARTASRNGRSLSNVSEHNRKYQSSSMKAPSESRTWMKRLSTSSSLSTFTPMLAPASYVAT